MGLVRVIVFAEGTDRNHEVVLPDDIPISNFLVMLILVLEMPQSDPSGNPLSYSLCERASGNVISMNSTLLQAAVLDGTELLLSTDDLSVEASLSWETTIQPKPADLESDSAISEVVEFDPTKTSLPAEEDRESSAGQPEQADSEDWTETSDDTGILSHLDLRKSADKPKHPSRGDSWSESSNSSVGIPSQLGRYKIVDQIGQGGMGVVFRGFDEQLNRNVAIKVLPGAMYNRPESMQRLLREARVGASVSHPHICQILDAGQDGGEFYIVMEYLEGQELNRLIKRDAELPIPHCCEFGYQLVQALEYLANSGIVHRDIKPSNLMVCTDGRLKLMDLGLVHQQNQSRSQQLTQSGLVLGTPAYMSPEQVNDSSRVSPATDLYAAGATLFEMFTRQLPFKRGSSLGETLMRIMTQPPPDPRGFRTDLPAQLAELVLRLLAKAPEDRPQHAEVLEILDGFRESSDVTVEPRPTAAVANEEPQCETVSEEIPRVAATMMQRIDQVEECLDATSRVNLLDRLPTEDGQIRLGNYDVQEQIGPRSAAKTILAKHSLTGIPYIIRIMPLAFGQLAPDQLRDLLSQRGELMRISKVNRYLSQLVDIGKAKLKDGNFRDIYYAVEDLLPGTPMNEIVDRGEPLELPIARRCLRQVASALHALHIGKLVHGNLHAGKIYFDSESNQLALTDLSRARKIEDQPVTDHPTGTMTAAGTALRDVDWMDDDSTRRRQYLAPEMLGKQNPSPSFLSEQYALGVILVEVLTGRFIRTHANDLELLKCVREDLEDRLFDISERSPRFSRVLQRLVATNPKTRFPDLRAVVQALQSRRSSTKRSENKKQNQRQRQKTNTTDSGSGNSFDIFVSYRRDPEAETALALKTKLEQEGFSVFMDVHSLSAGQFDEQLLATIETTPNFIVILAEGVLERCNDPEDWLRLEIAHAIRSDCNVIPMMKPGFRMPHPEDLPRHIRPLAKYQGVQYDPIFFDAAIAKLVKYLEK